MLNHSAARISLGILLALACAPGALAEDPAPGEVLLGTEYRDEPSGFRISPPIGSRVIQRGGVDLVSFIHDQYQWGVSVRLIKSTDPVQLAEMPAAILKELQATFKAVQLLDKTPVEISHRQALRLTTSMEAGEGALRQGLLRQFWVIPHPEDVHHYFAITFFSPLQRRQEAVRVGLAMEKSFEILNRQEIETRRRQAAMAGRNFLKEHRADELKSRLPLPPQYFRIRVDGRETGFLRLLMSETLRDGTRGILLIVDGRTFPTPQQLIMSQNELFWGYSQQPAGGVAGLHSWYNKVKTLDNSPGRPAGAKIPWSTELGICQIERHPVFRGTTDHEGRLVESASLQVVLGGDRAIPEPLKWDITAQMPAALPPVLPFAMGYLLDLQRPTQMAFVCFNSATNRLALRTLSSLGPQKLTLDGAVQDAFHLTDALDSGTTHLWVDSQGRILRLFTSDQTELLPTTQEQMDQLWGRRLAALEKLSP